MTTSTALTDQQQQQQQKTPHNISLLASRLPGPYQPFLITNLDAAYDVKLARIQGPFVWHAHPEADELFFVVRGELRVGLLLERGRSSEGEDKEHAGDDIDVEEEVTVTVKEGEMFVVRKGIRHRPDSVEGCEVLLFERKGTVNTGDNETEEAGGRRRDVGVF